MSKSSSLRFIIAIGVVGLLAQAGWVTLHFSTLPLWMEARFHTIKSLGVIIAAFLITEAVFRPPFGILSDYIGRKPVILFGTAASIASIAIIFIGNPYYIIPFTALDGTGLAAFWTGAFSLIGDRVDERHRSTAMSVLNGSMMAGVAFGWFIGGLVDDLAHSLVGSFYFVTLMFILATLIGYILFPSSTRVPREQRPAWRRHFRQFLKEELLDPLRIVPDMLVLNFIVFIGVGLIMPLMKLYTLQQYKISETVFGAIVGPAAIVLGVTAVFAGRLSDRWGHVPSVVAGVIFCAVGMWIVPSFHNLIIATAAAVLIGIGFVLAYPSWMAIASEAGSACTRGRIIGAIGLAEGLGAIFGVLLGPYLYASHWAAIKELGISSANVPFFLSAILLTAGAFIAIFWVSGTRARHQTR